MRRFPNRQVAGRRLGAAVREALRRLDVPDGLGAPVVVLGLPRGGVPVAAEVARLLNAPLDVLVVRKLGVPYQPELAMGAIGEGGALVLNHRVIDAARISANSLAATRAQESAELQRRVAEYRGGAEPIDLAGAIAIVVDDGVATGATARAACEVAAARGAARVVLAAPVAPPDTVRELRGVADEVVVLAAPVQFGSVGTYYRDFAQTSDAEVRQLLAMSRSAPQSDR